MAKSAEELNKALADAVVDMDEDLVADLANEVVDNGYDALNAIDQGLAKGMDEAGKLFEEEEYFVPELLMCSDAVNTGIDILKPHIHMEAAGEKHKIVVGVIEGDTHDIGKNIVRTVLENYGYEVIDLGRDVPPEVIVQTVEEDEIRLVGLSALMTTTLPAMEETIRQLHTLENPPMIMVGGAVVTPEYALHMQADYYAKDAREAAEIAKKVLG